MVAHKDLEDLDGAIVATTDAHNFAGQKGVVLLDGAMIGKLKLRYGKGIGRLSEEELAFPARGGKFGFDLSGSDKWWGAAGREAGPVPRVEFI